MLQRLIVLSGTIGAGKSAIARGLVERFSIERLSTRELIKARVPTAGDDRKKLQEAGAKLDNETGGKWIAAEVGRWLGNQSAGPRVVILDAVRQATQIAELRRQFSQAALHVHVDARVDIRKQRYTARAAQGDELSFEEVVADPIESNVHTLASIADVVLDTTYATAEDLVARVGGAAHLFGPMHEQLIDVVVGGQWGSEGKGQIAGYLAPEYDVLVRVGGPNAGHSVYAEPEPHKFHHLPSGWSRNRSGLLVLGPGAVIRVDELLKEINLFGVPVDQLQIDPCAMVISSDDIVDETLLEAAIGSTKRGVGAATARKVMRVEGSIAAWHPVALAGDHPDLKPFIFRTSETLERCYRERRRVLVEGTQGTMLSLHHGDKFPYVTSRDTTVAGCLSEAGISPTRIRKIMMVCRTYPIRVQSPSNETSGPMGIEIDWDVIAVRSGIPEAELRKNEHTTTTHKPRRVAEFNWNGVRQAALLNGPTDIAITFADYLHISNRDARRFDQLTDATRMFIEGVEQLTGAPVSLIAKDFSHSPIIDRRQW